MFSSNNWNIKEIGRLTWIRTSSWFICGFIAEDSYPLTSIYAKNGGNFRLLYGRNQSTYTSQSGFQHYIIEQRHSLLNLSRSIITRLNRWVHSFINNCRTQILDIRWPRKGFLFNAFIQFDRSAQSHIILLRNLSINSKLLLGLN